jgi:hypothetical protein
LGELLKPIVACLGDKSGEVRAKAEIMVEYLCINTPSAAGQVRDEINSLPKAQQLQLAPILEKYCRSAAGGAAAAASSSAGAAASAAAAAAKPGLARPGTSVGPAGAAASKIGGIGAGAKPGLVRPGTSSGIPSTSAAAPAPAKKVDKNAFDDDFVLRPSDKDGRLRREFRRYKGGFEELRPDEIEGAQEVLQAHAGAKLYSRLVSADFTENALALDYLAAKLPEQSPDCVLTNLDVLFKVLSARLAVPNCNPSVMMKALGAIDGLLKVCEGCGYHLMDLEADALVPALLEKALGHNNKQIQGRAVDVVQQLPKVLAPTKVYFN